MANAVGLSPEQETLVRAWISDLESGNFRQAIGVLGGEFVGYCCLGVLAKRVHDQSLTPRDCTIMLDSDVTSRAAGPVMVIDTILEGENRGMIPDSIKNLVGMDADDTGSLAHLNDSGGPFSQVASVILQWLEEGANIPRTTYDLVNEIVRRNQASTT